MVGKEEVMEEMVVEKVEERETQAVSRPAAESCVRVRSYGVCAYILARVYACVRARACVCAQLPPVREGAHPAS